MLEQAHSTGTLTLSSADPHEAPLIQQKMLSDERDVRRLVACFRDAIAFTKSTAMAHVIREVVFPDPRRSLSDASLAELVPRLAASGFHPCATVKMGLESDPLAIVDQYGRMRAVDGLVVADASIMPSVPRANTNLTSIMIGEMVGEWLRKEPGRYGL